MAVRVAVITETKDDEWTPAAGEEGTQRRLGSGTTKKGLGPAEKDLAKGGRGVEVRNGLGEVLNFFSWGRNFSCGSARRFQR